MARCLRAVVLLGGAALALALLPGRISVWIDEHGHATLTNREEPPEAAEALTPQELALRWRGDWIAEPLRGGADSSDPEQRFNRALLAARDDVTHGDLKRGLRELRRLHREHPGRPEPAWLLAQVERRRGRLESAREALVASLTLAAAMPDEWRDAGEALLQEIDADLEHAAQVGDGAPLRVQRAPHFEVAYDHQFAGRDFGERALEMLGAVRARLLESLGRDLGRPLEVRVYTRAQYLRAYEHRFGFATVGFYDGAIHVVSARHPREELFALLVHEYAHALFEEALGAHQPFFLNEGIADREEERARGRDGLAQSEWRRLIDAIRAREWLPLQSLVRGFGGLEGERALLAYLESRAAVELIETRLPGATARWLALCSDGAHWEDALVEATGWDTAGLEAALFEEVRARFPEDPLAPELPSPPPARLDAEARRPRPIDA